MTQWLPIGYSWQPWIHTTTKVQPHVVTTPSGKSGSWLWAKLGGKTERTKELRSVTPQGFALAFASRQVLTYDRERYIKRLGEKAEGRKTWG